MVEKFADDLNSNTNNDSTTAGSMSEILLAACEYQNPLKCAYGADPNVTNTINTLDKQEKIPVFNPTVTINAAPIKNPYSQATDTINRNINNEQQMLLRQTEWRGGDEDRIMQTAANHASTSNAPEVYADVLTAGTAAGETYLSYGSRVPQTEVQIANDTEKQYPYVLQDSNNYDLGGIALGYLYSAHAGLNGFKNSKPELFPPQASDVEKRIDYDINTIVGTKHDMPSILGKLSTSVYQEYSDHFETWRIEIKNRFDNNDPLHPFAYFNSPLLGTESKKVYEAKLNRDLALVDMAMVRNNAGNRQELMQEINSSLQRAANLDPGNADLPQLQDLQKMITCLP